MGMTYWLSYGGGVNSTALAVLLVLGKLPQYQPFRMVWADTGDEKDETYTYITDHFLPWLDLHGHALDIVRPKETPLQRWERLCVTGSRILRTCTVEGKIKPIETHVAANGGGISLIGIDAGEAHRAKERDGKVYPLVDLDIDRDGCEEIIRDAGLAVPIKSGCWHCPFSRVSDVISLAQNQPCKFERIARLEESVVARHGREGFFQWRDKPTGYWRQRASQKDLFIERDDMMPPCGCYDG